MPRNRIIIAMNKINASAGRRQLVRNRRLEVVSKRIAEIREDKRFQDRSNGEGCALQMEFAQLLNEGEALRTGCTGYTALDLFPDNCIRD